MLNTPFAPWPSFTDEECTAVTEVLRSNRVNYWTGEHCREFEKSFASYVEADHAVALANGTLALDVALRALQLSAGDEVIVTPRSYIASVSSVAMAGLIPVFADVDANDQNLSVDSISAVLSSKTKAILLVHLAGCPADLDGIMELANSNNLKVIEDCSQAHGALYQGQSVGSFGDIATWSFCQDKIMTTGGEGGMVTTNNRDLWSYMWSYKDHGKSFDAVYHREHAPGFRWLHESFGSNFRMLEMQAVIGNIQLSRMPQWTQKRLQNAHTIWAAAKSCPGLRVPPLSPLVQHAAYRAYVFTEPGKLKSGWDRDRIIAALGEQGVPAYSGSAAEIYREKAFENTGYAPPSRLPVARQLGETSIAFLVHPTLLDEEIDKTCQVLLHVMEQAQV